MSSFALTRGLDRFKDHVPAGHDRCQSFDGDRAYMFNLAGDVVTTRRRTGENDETLRFRLIAALTAISITEDAQ